MPALWFGRKANYVRQIRQVTTQHRTVAQRRHAEAYGCYVFVLRLRATSSCYAFTWRLSVVGRASSRSEPSRPLGGEGQARDDGGEERRGEAPTHHWTPGWSTTASRERGRKPGGPDYTRQARVFTNDAPPAIIHPERERTRDC